LENDHNPPPPHRACGPEQWLANAVLRIIVVAIGQRALEISKTMASVEQWVHFDGRHSIIVRKACENAHTHREVFKLIGLIF
jgi:hypothetical protein